LPRDIDANKVNAKYENGVLEVTVGKTGEERRPAGKTITIQ
jgi:HSP20 family molecular chaperone IbpA